MFIQGELFGTVLTPSTSLSPLSKERVWYRCVVPNQGNTEKLCVMLGQGKIFYGISGRTSKIDHAKCRIHIYDFLRRRNYCNNMFHFQASFKNIDIMKMFLQRNVKNFVPGHWIKYQFYVHRF